MYVLVLVWGVVAFAIAAIGVLARVPVPLVGIGLTALLLATWATSPRFRAHTLSIDPRF